MGSLARTRVRKYTWDDFIALDEADRRELIDGELVEIEVPNFIHEHIVMRLGFHLTGFTEKHGGAVLASGYKVRITEYRGVMPDVQVFKDGNWPGPEQETGLFRGRPDLAVEIVSPSSRRYDRMIKLGYYASIKVPEYWIVNPIDTTLDRLVLSKRKMYEIASSHEGDDVFAPPSFPGVRIPLATLWSTQPIRKPKRSRARAR